MTPKCISQAGIDVVVEIETGCYVLCRHADGSDRGRANDARSYLLGAELLPVKDLQNAVLTNMSVDLGGEIIIVG